MEMKASEWLELCNKVAVESGLPTGTKIDNIYFAAENAALRIIVAGNRFEAIVGAEPAKVIWKP